jgi:hypothetical protein
LYDLAYYESIRAVIIDPMHNLYLGTGKHFFEELRKRGILTVEQLEEITKQLKEIEKESPQDIGRFPRNVNDEDAIKGFTAEQWKNWINLFSIPCLTGKLDKRLLNIWKKFCMASIILSQRVITVHDVSRADNLLNEFSEEIEIIFGEEFITPNIHLHGHLASCILDFGPIYSFWLFSFERYNGILGDFPTSNRTIEVEIMKKFAIQNLVHSLEIADEEYNESLSELKDRSVKGSLEIGVMTNEEFEIYGRSFDAISPTFGYEKYGNRLPPFKKDVLSINLHNLLRKYYQKIYDIDQTNIRLFALNNAKIITFTKFEIGGEIFGSSSSKSSRSSFILTNWIKTEGIEELGEIYPGEIQYFFKHKIGKKSNEEDENFEPIEFTFAYVKFFQISQHLTNISFVNDIEIFNNTWKRNNYYQDQIDCFVPVARIISRFIPGLSGPNNNTFVICPIPRKFIF